MSTGVLRRAQAITTGDRLYWDSTNKCVNKTSTAQQCVGIAVADAANDQPTLDLLTQRLDLHEKTAWMLRSLLEDE